MNFAFTMKVIFTGSTGLVGEGVLLTLLHDARIEKVLSFSRRSCGISHPKLEELVVSDFLEIATFKNRFEDFDAVMYCAGISSLGLSEDEYMKVTYDMPLAFFSVALAVNPNLIVNHLSGAHTDATEKGKVMWARVKGKIENELSRLPFKAVYHYRPAIMKPVEGQKNVRGRYKIMRALFPVLKFLFPSNSCEIKQVGTSMINVTQNGYGKSVLEVKDIVTSS